MGFSVSMTYAVVAVAVLIALGLMLPVVQNTAEEVSGGLEDQRQRSDNVANTDISIVGVTYNYENDTVTVSVRNTGETALSVEHTNVLVDGRYVSRTGRNTTVSGNGTTELWKQAETLNITVDTQPPDRIKVVTEHGIAAFTELDVFRLTNDIAFTDTDNLRSIGPSDSITTYGATGQVIGPTVTGFASTGATELPAVNSSGDVFVVPDTGDRTDLASGARTSLSRLTAGQWQGSPPSVFFVDSGTQDIVRVTSNGSTTVVETVTAEGVSGIADFDDDGADELIYGGNTEGGSSNAVYYIDDNGSVAETGAGYGTNNGIGLGEPADFDGDGTVRVPIVDGSGNIQLVNSTGVTEGLTSENQAVKAPLGNADLDGDGEQEIYFVNTTGDLNVVDDVTTQNSVRAVTDAQGDTVSADDDAGAV